MRRSYEKQPRDTTINHAFGVTHFGQTVTEASSCHTYGLSHMQGGGPNVDYFDQQKVLKLQQLKQHEDKSPKGSIDAPIVDFMHELNRHPDYMTTR